MSYTEDESSDLNRDSSILSIVEKEETESFKHYFRAAIVTLENYQFAARFLLTDVYDFPCALLHAPDELKVNEPQALDTAITRTKVELESLRSKMEAGKDFAEKLSVARTAKELFEPHSVRISELYSTFQNLAVKEETLANDEWHRAVSPENFYAILGCAFFRPLDHATVILGEPLESYQGGCTPEMTGDLVGLRRLRQTIFIASIRRCISKYGTSSSIVERLRKEMLKCIVEGINLDELELPEEADTDPAPPDVHGSGSNTPPEVVTPPRATTLPPTFNLTPTSDDSDEHRNAVITPPSDIGSVDDTQSDLENHTFAESVPYVRAGDESDELFICPTLEEITSHAGDRNSGMHNVSIDDDEEEEEDEEIDDDDGDAGHDDSVESSSNTSKHQDTDLSDLSDTALLTTPYLMRRLVFFLDMMPHEMRISLRFYHFHGATPVPNIVATLAERRSVIVSNLIEGGESSLNLLVTAKRIYTLLLMWEDYIFLVAKDVKWDAAIVAPYLRDDLQLLGDKLQVFLQRLRPFLEPGFQPSSEEDFCFRVAEREARNATFNVYHLRHTVMFEFATLAPRA